MGHHLVANYRASPHLLRVFSKHHLERKIKKPSASWIVQETVKTGRATHFSHVFSAFSPVKWQNLRWYSLVPENGNDFLRHVEILTKLIKGDSMGIDPYHFPILKIGQIEQWPDQEFRCTFRWQKHGNSQENEGFLFARLEYQSVNHHFWLL